MLFLKLQLLSKGCAVIEAVICRLALIVTSDVQGMQVCMFV
jgi:hypothetical protein